MLKLIIGVKGTGKTKTQFVRGDFIGIADPEQVPDWVNENLEKYLHGQENTEDGGMKLE